MSVYKTPIVSGILVSLLIIYLILVPVVIHQYRKYNGIIVKKNIVIFSFIVYMVTAWFMTLLPLPAMEDVVKMPTIDPNFKPFLFVQTFLERTSFSLTSPSTWLSSLKSSSFYTVAFNVLLTVPFGVYLRKYFKVSLRRTLIFGFLLSCFYELTQYTGIYGIYPKAYRYADIDDVIVNTFGAGIGYLLTPILDKLLPNVDNIKNKNIYGEESGLIRRCVALIVDLFIGRLISFTLILVVNLIKGYVFGNKTEIAVLNYALEFINYTVLFIMVPLINRGNTWGMNILRLRLLSRDNSLPSRGKIIIRNIMLLLIFVARDLSPISGNKGDELIILIQVGIGGLMLILSFVFFISLIITIVRKKDYLIYDKLTKTKVIIESLND